MSKETFKVFVRNNPSLLEHINNNSMTWQKFYEMYDVYGENSSVWTPFLKDNTKNNFSTSSTNTYTKQQSLLGDTSLKELFNMVKTIDLDTVKKAVDGLTKAINLVQDLNSSKETPKGQTYEARPMYKYFED